MESTNIPVACTLSDDERHQREATIIAQFRAGVIATEELENGYAFQVPGEKNWLALVAELMTVERECCPFLSLQLNAEPKLGELTLRITGPEGTKEFLRSMFVS
jgi:hypothetical protein